jgi:hypothetical protein
MTLMYAACRKFGPASGERWTSYLDWSGLHEVREIISLDALLCPNLIDDLQAADWDYNIQEDNRICFFDDADYLRDRIGFDSRLHNLLAIDDAPQGPIELIDFEFCGYDILDSYDSISVLLNCGGFPGVYSHKELNQFGLLADLHRAEDVAKRLRHLKPHDDHCRACRVWAIARDMRDSPGHRD